MGNPGVIQRLKLGLTVRRIKRGVSELGTLLFMLSCGFDPVLNTARDILISLCGTCNVLTGRTSSVGRTGMKERAEVRHVPAGCRCRAVHLSSRAKPHPQTTNAPPAQNPLTPPHAAAFSTPYNNPEPGVRGTGLHLTES